MLHVNNSVILPHHTWVPMWFDLNGDKVEWTSTHADVSVSDWRLPLEQALKIPARLHVQLDIWHAVEDKIKGINKTDWAQSKHAYVITECVDPEIDNPRLLFSDFLFNRTKAYYSNFEFSDVYSRWYYQNPEDYQLPDIDYAGERHRVFISANRLHDRSQPFRRKLIDLVDRYRTIGHLSQPFPLPSASQQEPRGYSPVHADFYQDSFLSVYAETLEQGTTIMVTEKTWDPLIRGHFVLPFGPAGLINNIKDRGFLFPDFIDYSYSEIKDDQSRWNSYQHELQRLLSLPLHDWHDHWHNNISLIKHNRDRFFQMPYHRIDWAQLA